MEKQIDLQDGDDITIRFLKDTVVECFQSDDPELDEPIEELFRVGETCEGTVFGVDPLKIDFQFGDGSVAFIRRNLVEVVILNNELV